MFFENLSEIESIALKTGCSIFVLPENQDFTLKNAINLKPEEKSVITMDQVKDVLAKLSTKQTTDLFIIIRPAEKMEVATANALLKNLEEPGEKIHFLLITDAISKILPTIKSRANIYFLKTPYTDDIEANETLKTAAKKLMVATPKDLPALAEEFTKKKDRAFVLSVLSLAIEMSYKSYYKTKKSAFLAKIPKFLTAYDNINNNGHIKLHLVADLL